MERELLRMPRGDLPADGELALILLDDKIADAPVGELADLCLDLLRQSRPGVKTIDNHGVTLWERRYKAASTEPDRTQKMLVALYATPARLKRKRVVRDSAPKIFAEPVLPAETEGAAQARAIGDTRLNV